jgi:hypothetical protein
MDTKKLHENLGFQNSHDTATNLTFMAALCTNMGNDHLTKIHLIEIVIFQLIEIFNN